MQRRLSVIITGLLVVSFIQAQTDETLTNNAIVKMVKAKLSNELIIDVIQNSTTLFDLNENDIKNLENENVSSQVIEAMKIAKDAKASSVKIIAPVKEQGTEKSVTGPPPVQTIAKTADIPIAVKQKDAVQSTNVMDALNYVAPIKDLVTYYQKEIESLDGTITDWDNKIRTTLKEVNEINEQITQLESDLREKKNADSKGYSSEILSMKKKMSECRVNYKTLKTKLFTEGQNITKKLTDMSTEMARSIGNKYNDVSQLVKSSNTDPGAGEKPVPITFTGPDTNENTTYYIAPATEMLVWHQNEINELQNLVEKWNPRVKEIIQKDAELKTKLQPINSKLEEYKSDSKKYKAEIATLKKQRDGIEKERKQLAGQMENDSKALAAYLKTHSEEIQNSVKQRFADIIGNINYSYQEKLNL
jgi:uncharacterized coiled-coil DUF342 family protein